MRLDSGAKSCRHRASPNRRIAADGGGVGGDRRRTVDWPLRPLRRRRPDSVVAIVVAAVEEAAAVVAAAAVVGHLLQHCLHRLQCSSANSRNKPLDSLPPLQPFAGGDGADAAGGQLRLLQRRLDGAVGGGDDAEGWPRDADEEASCCVQPLASRLLLR